MDRWAGWAHRPGDQLIDIRRTIRDPFMAWLIMKAVGSAIIIVIVSEVAKRQPGTGALIASLPLISILGMIWLWRDTADVQRLAEHSAATFWFVLPSLPMFLVIPMLLRRGLGFWWALGLGCLLTIALYLLTTVLLARLGVKL